MTETFVKVSRKGMISIPAAIRKKYHIIEGQYMLVSENEDGIIKLEPVETAESLRKHGMTTAEFKKILLQSRKEDMELEK